MREQLKQRLARSRKRRNKYKRRKRAMWLFISLIVILGYCLPDPAVIPVQNATHENWDPDSFWYYPWGTSVTHKGIDIFSEEGTPVISDGYGLVTFVGTYSKGGKVALVLGPKWKMHYYAHMSEQSVRAFQIVKTGDEIGKVGDTGNAAGKPPHLHYSVRNVLPYPWRWAKGPHGHKRMFYDDPGERYAQ